MEDSLRLTISIEDAIEEAVRSHLGHLPAGVVLGQRRPGVPSALIAFRPPADEDLAAYDWVHVAGAGADHILGALPREGDKLPVLTRTTGLMGRQIGEFCLAYVLADLQGMALRENLAAKARWDQHAALPAFLFDRDVAVIGTGAIGGGIAEAIKPFARSVTGYNRSGRPTEPFDRTAPLGAFEGASIVIAALPATPGSDGVLSHGFFGVLDRALFINVGRGATLDEDALRAALEAGQVRRAVLDVFRTEPLPPEHWAWHDERVTVTPHVSGVTRTEDTAAAFLERLPHFLAGTLANEIDPAQGY